MRELLSFQDGRGLFPTIGLKRNSERSLDSIFLHTFVLEYLLDHYSEGLAEAIQRGIDFLVSQAIYENGIYVWQWLKNPKQKEDYRPPDTDDTMRARLVIEKAFQRGFNVKREFKYFNYEYFLLPLMANDGSIRTYIKDRYSGSCPVVNANILYALTSIGGHDEIRYRIKEYLKHAANSISFDPNVFTEQSKYYTSSLFPVYVLSKTIVVDPNFFSTTEKQRVLEYSKRVAPENILENVWQQSILKNLGQKSSSVTELSFDYVPLFRSRKLKEYYGSHSVTAIFCLESIQR